MKIDLDLCRWMCRLASFLSLYEDKNKQSRGFVMTLLFEVFCQSFCLLSQTFASTALSSLNHLTLLFFPIFPCILNDVDGRFNLSKTRKAPNQPILPCSLKYVKYSTSSWEKQIYRARAPAFQKLHPAVHLSFLLWVLFVLEIDFIISKKKTAAFTSETE